MRCLPAALNSGPAFCLGSLKKEPLITQLAEACGGMRFGAVAFKVRFCHVPVRS